MRACREPKGGVVSGELNRLEGDGEGHARVDVQGPLEL